MKIYSSSKCICVLIAMILFLNPVIVAADAIFSFSSQEITLASEANAESSMPCHDVKQVEKARTEEPRSEEPKTNSDCCVDLCLCDSAGCHGVSLLFQSSRPTIISAFLASDFDLSNYSSLITIPGSPPPIV